MSVSNQNVHRPQGFSGRAQRAFDRVHMSTREGHKIILPGQKLDDACRRGADRRKQNRNIRPGSLVNIYV